MAKFDPNKVIYRFETGESDNVEGMSIKITPKKLAVGALVAGTVIALAGPPAGDKLDQDLRNGKEVEEVDHSSDGHHDEVTEQGIGNTTPRTMDDVIQEGIDGAIDPDPRDPDTLFEDPNAPPRYDEPGQLDA